MSETVIQPRTYLSIWGVLLALLAVTVGVAYVHLAWLNPVVALSIAVIKAVIIMLYFMHLRNSPRLVWVFVGAGFAWLGIMFVLSLGDYLARQYLPKPTMWLP
ncbi:MAG TPA: cytochrome C oxidase subunit IV family protein [Terriglobia bacterium]|nr:cytochrome C oxidase subunit IV family protein [Terriglobia bacterium]